MSGIFPPPSCDGDGYRIWLFMPFDREFAICWYAIPCGVCDAYRDGCSEVCGETRPSEPPSVFILAPPLGT